MHIVTLAEGEISEMTVGFKGTMGALYLKDLSAITRRGNRGKVLDGKSGGGRCYGYRVTGDGEYRVEPHEAAVVERIFREAGLPALY